MQKFVVKKSKSAPLPPSQSSAVVQQQSVQVSTANPSNSLSSGTSSSLSASNKTTKTVTSKTSTTSIVKMSGYLKKKRNKMGGWRKLWFVLQNQLLLSYSSKEDYEKKLAPFKDVLNLVPGTIIRATKGPRFIIETSTNLIYTYRCDNNKICSEWVTALLESLRIISSGDGKLILVPNKLHFSLENLSKSNPHTSSSTSPASSFMSSQSCDSIYRSNGGKVAAPKLPVAQNTARLLERVQGSPNTSKVNPKSSHAEHKVQNFRLHHQNESHVNQSNEVHRINRMFSINSSVPSNNNITNIDNKNRNHHNRSNQNSSVNQSNHNKSINSHNHNHNNNNNSNRKSVNSDVVDERALIIGDDWRKKNGYHRDKNSKRINIHTKMDAESVMQSNGSGNCSLEERMQSISLHCSNNSSNAETANVRKTSGASSSVSPLSSVSSVSSGSSVASNASTASASKFELIAKSRDTKMENVNAIIALDQQNSRMQTSVVGKSSSGEPIYAVVDLKNKYANRAKKKSIDHEVVGNCIHTDKGRPNSFHVVSGDYEEVLQLSSDCVDGPDDDENIYEPINIPELSTRGPLWRYFSKINIDALVEITRRKKEQHHQNLEKSESSTAFSDIRKRFGHHRKSIKNRMKKFYNRSNSNEMEEVNTHSNGLNGFEVSNLGSQGASCSSASDSGGKSTPENRNRRTNVGKDESGYFHKRDRHLFGSMLKKSRTSLCLDDGSPRKKLLMVIGNGDGVKKRFNRSFEKKECHSRFYD